MPKLWTDTIDAHRRAVRDATLNATAALVEKHGLAAVTMSQIAEDTGIGRATLYKYFPDVKTILEAWHERQIAGHLDELTATRDGSVDSRERLQAVLETFALRSREHRGSELAALLHRSHHVVQAERQLLDFVTQLISDAANAGHVRGDVDPGELATYSLHALTAAGSLSSVAAARRLVAVTMAGLRPQD